MNIFDKIRLFFLNRAIRKELRTQHRQVKITNLEKAKTIGVVFNAATENDYQRAAGLIRHLKAQDKLVNSIALVPYKDIPHYLPAKISSDYITLKDLNWYRKPRNQFSRDFINKEFDMLIDLNLQQNDSLRYVVSLSKARFKIGLFNEEYKDIYDFMLEGIKPTQVSLFIKEVLHYLEIFKPKE